MEFNENVICKEAVEKGFGFISFKNICWWGYI